MSDITMFNPAQLPAFAKNKELSALAKALVGSAAVGKRISIKGGVFRLLAAGKEVAAVEERHLDVVIVAAAANIGRTWYAATFDSKAEATTPDCWSADGERPDREAKRPQNKTCVGCPKNMSGSGQGNSRACRYQQRIAVVLANDIEGDIMQMTLPATSIFGAGDGDNRPLQAYAHYLVAQGAEPSGLVTRMKFDTSSEAPKLVFKPMRWLTETEYTTAQEKGSSADAAKAVAMAMAKNKDSATTLTALEAPKKETTTSDDVAVSESEGDVEDVKLVERARKDASKLTVVPTKKTSLAAAVTDWDDE